MSEFQRLIIQKIKKKEESIRVIQDDGKILSLSDELKKPQNTTAEGNLNEPISRSELKPNVRTEIDALFNIQEQYSDQSSGVKFQTYFIEAKSAKQPTIVFIHGAGSSSMTFHSLVKLLSIEKDAPGMFVFDLRGHGMSSDPSVYDFNLDTLTNDLEFVLDELQKRHSTISGLYLLGHSLGGSIATNYIDRKKSKVDIKGLIVLDIVEETAVKALSSMPQFILQMPSRFASIEEGIEWHLKKGLLYNSVSSEISIPYILKKRGDYYVWRTDLNRTKEFWSTWFVGLSDKFISCDRERHVAKLILLSGHESLDKTLIMGQMQGKFQLVAFNNEHKVGHFLQEDIPGKVSITIMDFIRRNSGAIHLSSGKGMVPKWGGAINT